MDVSSYISEWLAADFCFSGLNASTSLTRSAEALAREKAIMSIPAIKSENNTCVT